MFTYPFKIYLAINRRSYKKYMDREERRQSYYENVIAINHNNSLMVKRQRQQQDYLDKLT
jgi:hypothetical protein